MDVVSCVGDSRLRSASSAKAEPGLCDVLVSADSSGATASTLPVESRDPQRVNTAVISGAAHGMQAGLD